MAGSSRPGAGTGSVVPCLRYRDAPAAIDWLCDAFGFERHAVYPNGDGTIAHAEISTGRTGGRGLVMLGSAVESDYGALMRQPDELGGANTQGIYVVVADVDAHYARARAAGARIAIDIRDQDYGGRDYTCRDPEGHVWTFGNYDPWAE